MASEPRLFEAATLAESVSIELREELSALNLILESLESEHNDTIKTGLEGCLLKRLGDYINALNFIFYGLISSVERLESGAKSLYSTAKNPDCG